MKEKFGSETEEKLLLALKDGSESSFDQIYDSLYAALYNYGFRLCGSEDLVKDCIQDTFIEIWEKRHGLEKINSLKFYLFKIIRRKIFAYLDAEAKAENKIKLAILNGGDFLLLFKVDQLEKECELPTVIVRKISKAISQLTARQKEAIMLKFYENLSYSEITGVMDLKDTKYARQLVYRALDELKESLSIEYGISRYASLLYVIASVDLLKTIT